MHDPSLNAGKHWMTSRRLVITGETIEDFNRFAAKWFVEYDASTEIAADLIGTAAEEAWILLRYKRGFDDVCLPLFEKSQSQWSEQEHKTHQRTTRYLTAQTRAARAAHRDIQHYRREKRLEDKANLLQQKKEETVAAANAPPPLPPSQRPDRHIEQLIKVRVIDGVTVTRMSPTNEEVLAEGESRVETALVRRCYGFLDGAPPEYHDWLDENGEFPNGNPRFVQSMTLAQFRVAVTFETDGIARPYPPWTETDNL